MEPGDFGSLRIDTRQIIQQIVCVDQFLVGVAGLEAFPIRIEAFSLAAAFKRKPRAGSIYENPSHCLSRGRKEVAAAIPRWGRTRLSIHESKIGFMDKGSRIERLAGLLLSQLPGRYFPQLVIDKR